MRDELISLAKDSPIPVVGGLTFMGYQLSDLVLIITFIYTLLRIAKIIKNWNKE